MDRSEVAEVICERIAGGQTLVAICKAEDMPSTRTFLRWANEDADIADAYRTALAARAEWYAAEHDCIRKTAKDRESAIAARVQLQALEWQMQRAAPKRYGDKVEHTVAVDTSLTTALEAARRRAALDLDRGQPEPIEIHLLEYSPESPRQAEHD